MVEAHKYSKGLVHKEGILWIIQSSLHGAQKNLREPLLLVKSWGCPSILPIEDIITLG